MRGLSAADVLRVWERGAGQHPIDRALTILAAGDPGAADTSSGDLPLGERNRRLLAIHERTFGGTLCFAGEATEGETQGTVEGALASAKRAVRTLLRRLRD